MSSRLVSVIIQVATIVLFALVSAAIPEYTWLFFLLYFGVLMIITMRATTRSFKKVREIKGSPLFKEENTASIMANDTLLLQELREQFKLMTFPLLFTLVAIALYPLYWQYVDPIVKSFVYGATNNLFITKFVEFLMFYAFLITAISVPRILIMRKLRQKKQLYIPRVFSVYKDGIYADGRMVEYSRDTCYKTNSKRKFVEIHSPKAPFIIRLYTLEVSKLADRLREVGLYECRV